LGLGGCLDSLFPRGASCWAYLPTALRPSRELRPPDAGRQAGSDCGGGFEAAWTLRQVRWTVCMSNFPAVCAYRQSDFIDTVQASLFLRGCHGTDSNPVWQYQGFSYRAWPACDRLSSPVKAHSSHRHQGTT